MTAREQTIAGLHSLLHLLPESMAGLTAEQWAEMPDLSEKLEGERLARGLSYAQVDKLANMACGRRWSMFISPADYRDTLDLVRGFKLITVLITLLLITLLTNARARAAEVTLTWDPNPDTNVTGSFLYYGPPGVYTNRIDCGPSLTNTITGLATNTPYAFATTAYNAAGLESDPSPELILTLPTLTRSNAPTMVQITTYLETTTYGLAWLPVTQWSISLPATNLIQYFRPRASIIQTN